MRKYKLTPVAKVTDVHMASLHVIAYVYTKFSKGCFGNWTLDIWAYGTQCNALLE